MTHSIFLNMGSFVIFKNFSWSLMMTPTLFGLSVRASSLPLPAAFKQHPKFGKNPKYYKVNQYTCQNPQNYVSFSNLNFEMGLTYHTMSVLKISFYCILLLQSNSIIFSMMVLRLFPSFESASSANKTHLVKSEWLKSNDRFCPIVIFLACNKRYVH